MTTCDVFRAQFAPATEDATQLEHLRSCDACLNFAVELDGDVLFRALGGDEMVPAGGVDAFVDDVMREVRLRGMESRFAGHPTRWTGRLAVAATIAAAITGSAFIYERSREVIVIAPVPHHTIAARSASKPIIESYDSQNATIVEVPSEGEDVKVVMVFDENLPADL